MVSASFVSQSFKPVSHSTVENYDSDASASSKSVSSDSLRGAVKRHIFKKDTQWIHRKDLIVTTLDYQKSTGFELPTVDVNDIVKKIESDSGRLKNKKTSAKTKARLEKRLAQIKRINHWVKARNLQIIGFDGWGEGCLKIDGVKPAQKRTNIGEYDSVIYFDEIGEIQVKRLNSTISFVEETGLETGLDIHLETRSEENHKKYIERESNSNLIEHLDDGRVWLTRKGSMQPGRKVATSKMLTSVASGFAVDGPDDAANAAKEGVHGIAQPILHLGVLGLFTPFVLMGERGLTAEHRESGETKEELEEKKDILQSALFGVYENHVQIKSGILNELGIHIDLAGLKNAKSVKKLVKRISNKINQNTSRQDGEKATKAFLQLISYYQISSELELATKESRELFAAKWGMRGMLSAMVLFLNEAATQLSAMKVSGLISGNLELASFASSIVGTSSMGVGQLMMSVSGILNTAKGVGQWRSIRQSAQRLEELALNHHYAEILKSMAADKRQEAKHAAWNTEMIPGAELTAGQLLMLSVSIMSLVSFATGVASPLGFAGMTGLAASGAGATILSVFHGKRNESIKENLLAKHGETEGFSERDYLNSVLSSFSGKQEGNFQSRLSKGVQLMIEKFEENKTQLDELNSEKNLSTASILSADGVSLTASADNKENFGKLLTKMETLGCYDDFLERFYHQRKLSVKSGRKFKLGTTAWDVFDRKTISLHQKRRFHNPFKSKRQTFYSLNKQALYERFRSKITGEQTRKDFYLAATNALKEHMILRLRAMNSTLSDGVSVLSALSPQHIPQPEIPPSNNVNIEIEVSALI